MRLAKHIAPKVRESLVGFLMRAAEANHMQSVSVLHTFVGRKSRPPAIEETERLALFCGCSAEEVAQLFGFQVQRQDGGRAWRLGGEWVTKENFVSSRTMAVCCECLCDDPHLPGTWELTFYCCCAFHRTRLLTVCPDCGKQLSWTRPKVWQCGCGFDFRQTKTNAGTPYAWVTAELIEHRLDPHFPITIPVGVPHHVVERLGKLSLDGLFKTIWFLGHCVGGFDTCTSGHGRLKRKDGHAEASIDAAFSLLSRWPESLRERLEALSRRPGTEGERGLYRRMFGPLVSYLEQEPANGELVFVRLAYEQEIRRLWRARGRKLPRRLGYQLELDLGS